jgi:ankyrin repeat protein
MLPDRQIFGQAALWAAAFHGHTPVVELLVAMDGITINHKDAGGGTPLCSAAGRGHEAVVKLLLATDGERHHSLMPRG